MIWNVVERKFEPVQVTEQICRNLQRATNVKAGFPEYAIDVCV
jgi:hypothetical protein